MARRGALLGQRRLNPLGALKKCSGRQRRRIADLRTALLRQCGGEAATPESIWQVLERILSKEEMSFGWSKIADELRRSEAADAAWLQWSQLGRQLAPAVLSACGFRGQQLVGTAARAQKIPL